jgi:tRNA modification GTPase
LSRCIPTASTQLIRHAEPGEFTRRAFLNNRLDLTQVEALSDVLCAQTEQQRRLSVRGTSGRLAKTYEDWRARLLQARAELEALIDFQEDQHFDEEPGVLAASVAGQVVRLKRRIERHIENAVRGELLRNGIGIALLGAPNAGKSSLLNRIVGREAAIVSQEAGTTRDVVEVGLDVAGYFCRLGDMAGLRSSNNSPEDITQVQTQLAEASVGKIEEEGIRRAKQRALESDVLIVVLSVELDHNAEPYLPFPSDVLSTANESGSEIVVVINKIDLIPQPNRQTLIATWAASLRPYFKNLEPDRVFPISCKLASTTSEHQSVAIDPDPGNIQIFLRGLSAVFKRMTEPISLGFDQHTTSVADDPSLFQDSLGASERHKLLLEECRGHLDTFLGQVYFPALSTATKFERLGEETNGPREEDVDIVIAAESLREAADCLARITGKGEAGDVEEVLGVVFEKYVFPSRALV